METAVWNGVLYTALEVANDYELEKKIRLVSGIELRCPDGECTSPIVKYCHGEVKQAYFAHVSNCRCDYADFDRETPSAVKSVKQAIYQNFHSRGYKVTMDEKLLSHHYTHLVFEFDGQKVAVEFATNQTSARKLETITAQYREANIKIFWIVIDNVGISIDEKHIFFAKRYLLNELFQKTLIVIDAEGKYITQYVLDKNKYMYDNCEISSKNYPKMYYEDAELGKLVLNSEKFEIDGFQARFEKWLVTKKRAFDKKVKELELQKARAYNYKKYTVYPKKSNFEDSMGSPIANEYKTSDYVNPNNTFFQPYDELVITEPINNTQSFYKEYDALFAQNKKIVVDTQKNRLYKCKKCGHIGTDVDFWLMGDCGLNGAECNRCRDAQKEENANNS